MDQQYLLMYLIMNPSLEDENIFIVVPRIELGILVYETNVIPLNYTTKTFYVNLMFM